MIELAWLLLALPAAGALFTLFVGGRLDKRTLGMIASSAIAAAFLVGVGVLAALVGLPAEERSVTVHLWDWITIGDFQVPAALLIDPLSAVMTLIVTGVGAIIHFYSISYMEHDERFQRFFFYLNFFIFAMMLLVLGNNFLGMFVGWEGVGLASYLLIGFWFDRRDDSYGYYADAGKKAFIVNRVGDFGMIVAMLAIWSALGTLNFLDVFEQVEHGALTVGAANVICLLLLLAATGKSAQIPLYVWLPDAMAGPTPVSALIHAATMVTAGIYMIARTHVFWHVAEQAATTAAWIGALTAFFAATIALVQVDIKKILAYSTISQLGYMMLGVGVGSYGAAIFHLTTHAFFKALLFLAAGSVMHALNGELDIRKMGGLRHKMPATFRAFLVGAAALAGIPPLSGFFSKDAILLGALAANPFLYVIGLVTALLTAFYSFRALLVPFYGEPRDRHLYDHAHESPPLITTPLWILAALSILGGLLNLPFVLTLDKWLEPALGAHEAPLLTLELLAITLSVIAALFGAVMAWARYMTNEPWPRRLASRFSWLEPALQRRWYVDDFYWNYIVVPLRNLSTWFATVFDQQVIDGAVNWFATTSIQLGERARRIQTGAIPAYALSILVGVVVLVAFFVFSA
ncbi:MAG: NADH-quinone oxidoreductase subunit L [Caldilineaceae bacterium]|nr:NADH-quinone oxidoreductase subunit L [Caldilineaceae bacterium]